MVIAEILKHRLNSGKKSNLYFYRDSKGNEIDLLLVNGPDIFPIEIKAGMTVTRDYFKGLNYFIKLFPNRIPAGSGLVYGGDETQSRTGVSIVPLSHLDTLLTLANPSE
jgi:predicted AAA+ superfamily ATPase